MTEKPKKRSIWRMEEADKSPVSRLRFTENEWKLILKAIGFYADYLAEQEYPKHRHFWLNSEYFQAHETDPESELGKQWRIHTDKCGEIKTKVRELNLIERQLELHFKIINGKTKEWMRTVHRVMH